MFSQIDSQGNHFLLLKKIKNQYKYASSITGNNGFLTSKYGNFHAKKTTIGWTF